jgi:membrane protease YdiL (CAAX protease family)
MFTRYWRTYPWFLQLFLFAMMIVTFSSLGTYFTLSILPGITGVPFADIQHIGAASSMQVTRAGVVTQALFHVFAFTIPCLLFAYFTTPRPAAYLGLRLPGKPVHWLLVTGIMIGFLPFSIYLETWLQQHVDFGQAAEAVQAKTDAAFAAYLKMQSSGDFLRAFLAFAIIPPIGEELMFRALFMRFSHSRQRIRKGLVATVGDQKIFEQPRKRRMVLPILLTAAIFAFMHPNPYGRIFIFAAGILLSLIYWLTSSLLCSIWAHLLFNGSQVVYVFLTRNHAPSSGPEGSANIPLWMPVLGFCLLAASLYALSKYRTPLPANWSADYTEEELRREEKLM